MGMPVGDATAVNTLILWAMGRKAHWAGGPEVTAAEAGKAAKQLAAKAYKTLSAGLLPDEADLSCRVVLDLSDPDVRHVLTQALQDYATYERAMAENGAGESFARWAELADRMRAQVEAAG
jgi:hypothetical protein